VRSTSSVPRQFVRLKKVKLHTKKTATAHHI
jgi:hypothetical protein